MATVPTIETFVAGEKLTGAKLTRNITDVGNFLMNPPRATMSRTGAGQSIANTAYTFIQFDTEDVDTDGMINLGSSNTTLTIQTNGTYDLLAGCTFATHSTGGRLIRIMVNGAAIRYNGIPAIPGLVSGVQCAAMTIDLNAGDSVGVTVYQSSGGSLLTTASGTGDREFLSVRWVAV
jgi:hypothetical protein